jgi:hypothetical protein
LGQGVSARHSLGLLVGWGLVSTFSLLVQFLTQQIIYARLTFLSFQVLPKE